MKYKRIYIIGPVGSGKTTLAKTIAKKTKIKHYELDKVVWDDENHIKRSNEEIDKIFNKIIREKNWIIEDVGRNKFKKGLKESDMVYFINLNSIVIYKRIIIRWLKQILKKETYNYKPTIRSLFDMFKWADKDIKNKNNKLKIIQTNCKSYKVLNRKDLNKLINKYK